MLEHLEWQKLEDRRQQARLFMLYKANHNLVALNTCDYLVPIPRLGTVHTHGYLIPHSRTDYHKYSFFPRAAREWNQLPAHIIEAPSAETFKSHLIKHLEKTPIKPF